MGLHTPRFLFGFLLRLVRVCGKESGVPVPVPPPSLHLDRFCRQDACGLLRFGVSFDCHGQYSQPGGMVPGSYSGLASSRSLCTPLLGLTLRLGPRAA